MYSVPLLKKTGLFSGLDVHFAGFMATLCQTDDPTVTLAAALATWAGCLNGRMMLATPRAIVDVCAARYPR